MNQSGRILFWNGRTGLAYFDGVHVELHVPPRVPGMNVEQIDYSSDVGLVSVLEVGKKWRQLDHLEQHVVDAVLWRMSNAVRQAVC